MNANLTKLIGSAVAIVLAMGSSAFAQNNMMKSGNNCNPPSCPEPKGGCPCPPFEKTCPCPPGVCPCPPFEQGEPLTNCVKFPPAYNAPAALDVQCSWDVFVTASFTYWNIVQEGMNTGTVTAQSAATDQTFAPNFGQFTGPDFKYKPGFKVGLGMDFDYDNWVGFLEYTWMHSTIDTTVTPPADFRGTAVIVLNNWFLPNNNNTVTAAGLLTNASNYSAATSLSTSWKLKFSMLDATLSRPFYQGRSLTVSPYAGARTVWLSQNYHLQATELKDAATVPNPINSYNRSTSWAMGPVGGACGHWLLGWGFRAEGNMGASLGYTTYTQVIHREDNALGGTTTPSIAYKYRRYHAIRPMANMGMGLGWGTYLDRQSFHFDLAADYDFMVLWDQNMLRALVDEYNHGVGAQAANLYFQGLTLTARFDF